MVLLKRAYMPSSASWCICSARAQSAPTHAAENVLSDICLYDNRGVQETRCSHAGNLRRHRPCGDVNLPLGRFNQNLIGYAKDNV
eukprot:363096-Chlamydomonas_euryale.AAC.6